MKSKKVAGRWFIVLVCILAGFIQPSLGMAADIDILHSFGVSAEDGTYPVDSLIADKTTLYGVAASGGGAGHDGVIFKINKDGTGYAILHAFQDWTSGNGDGCNPIGSLTLSGSTLYGMTQDGGGAEKGTIFKINTDGTGYAVLHSFGSATVANDGYFPRGSLVLAGTTLYGMTPYGGTGDEGVIFKINTDGSAYTLLHSFDDDTVANDGRSPFGSLILSRSTLYGMTRVGGTGGQGTVFRINTDGTGYTILHGFRDGTVIHDGINPYGSLILSGSTLYGMTNNGGAGGEEGVIFKINTDGSHPTLLHSFQDGTVANDGAAPWGNLVLSGSTLYGMTKSGGFAGQGVVFKIRTNGTRHTILHLFGDGTVVGDGWNPYGSLLLSGSTLYGMSSGGGSAAAGALFALHLPPALPGAPTDVKATAGNGRAKVTFAPPDSDGGSPISFYTVTSIPGGITKKGKATSLVVTGLTNGTTYTFKVRATNAVGIGPASKPSNKVTPHP